MSKKGTLSEVDKLNKEVEKFIEKRKERDKELKRFFRGKKWNKKQRKELESQDKPPLKLNRIKKGEK